MYEYQKPRKGNKVWWLKVVKPTHCSKLSVGDITWVSTENFEFVKTRDGNYHIEGNRHRLNFNVEDFEILYLAEKFKEEKAKEPKYEYGNPPKGEKVWWMKVLKPLNRTDSHENRLPKKGCDIKVGDITWFDVGRRNNTSRYHKDYTLIENNRFGVNLNSDCFQELYLSEKYEGESRTEESETAEPNYQEYVMSPVPPNRDIVYLKLWSNIRGTSNHSEGNAAIFDANIGIGSDTWIEKRIWEDSTLSAYIEGNRFKTNFEKKDFEVMGSGSTQEVRPPYECFPIPAIDAIKLRVIVDVPNSYLRKNVTNIMLVGDITWTTKDNWTTDGCIFPENNRHRENIVKSHFEEVVGTSMQDAGGYLTSDMRKDAESMLLSFPSDLIGGESFADIANKAVTMHTPDITGKFHTDILSNIPAMSALVDKNPFDNSVSWDPLNIGLGGAQIGQGYYSSTGVSSSPCSIEETTEEEAKDGHAWYDAAENDFPKELLDEKPDTDEECTPMTNIE